MKMAIPKVIPKGVSKTVARAVLKTKKTSPEILLVVGVVSIVGGTVLACQATLKVDDILNEHEATAEKINKALEVKPDEYSEHDAQKDRALMFVKTGVKLGKVYAPGAGLIIVGIVCICASHGIMRKRNAALMVAYRGLKDILDAYRGRVKEELGEGADHHFMYGTEYLNDARPDWRNPEFDDNEIVPGTNVSMYARFFDESSPEFQKNSERNLYFLRTVQETANMYLHSRGHLFLNEVYDMLGIPRTSAGAVVGWVEGNGSDYVDFGIYKVNNERSRAFVNGDERAILLDFNVDGVIYDLI